MPNRDESAAYLWRVERKSDGDSWFAETSTTANEEHARLWLTERRERHPESTYRLIRREVKPWEVVSDEPGPDDPNMPRLPLTTLDDHAANVGGGAMDGAVIVRKSAHPTHPYYLQKVINAWDDIRYYHAHALIGEEFATLEEAQARAAELA